MGVESPLARKAHGSQPRAHYNLRLMMMALLFSILDFLVHRPSAITASVLDIFATSTRSPSRSPQTSPSTNTRFFPARNTFARHVNSLPEAGLRNEVLF